MVLPGTTFSHAIQSRQPVYGSVFPEEMDLNEAPNHQIITSSAENAQGLQSVAIPGSDKPGYSSVYRNYRSVNKLVTSPHPHLKTVRDALETSVKCEPELKCLGERRYNTETKAWSDYQWLNYRQVHQRVWNASAGIVRVVERHVGVNPRDEQYNVGLYGSNSRNWLIVDVACAYTRISSISLYDTLGRDSSQYIINLTEMNTLFADSRFIPGLISNLKNLPKLKIIVSLQPFDDLVNIPKAGTTKEELFELAKNSGIHLYDITQIEKEGEGHHDVVTAPKPDDVFTINFTSGTTGAMPKGVILTHQNIISGFVRSLYREIKTENDEQISYLSFLPLAHIYERVNLHIFLFRCMAIGFIHGDVATTMFEDIKLVKPQFICGVPRIWNKLAAKIRQNTIEASGKFGEISREAYAEKLEVLKETGNPRSEKWDKIWSDPLRKTLGFEKTTLLGTGAAPLANENIELLSCALAVDFSQGYGLTETSSGFAVCKLGDARSGSNGPVAANSEVRLRSLPELGYSVKDKPNPRGEIMFRSPQLFKGYYKNEEETDRAFDKDGWFHTGDVGSIDDKGRLYVIDRVKNMFKLAQGEYVAPERIEALYSSSSSIIAQIFLEGQSLHSYLVAVIGVNPEVYPSFLKQRFKLDIEPSNVDGLKATFGRKDVRIEFLKQINAAAKTAGVQGFEQPRNVALMFEPLSTANGTLTPTLKLRRIPARNLYKKTIEDLYAEGSLLDVEKPSPKL